MTGILCLFTEAHTAGTRDSEMFVNPNIKSIFVNIDDIPNRLSSKGMEPTDTWESIKKRMGKDGWLKEKNFYTAINMRCGLIYEPILTMGFMEVG